MLTERISFYSHYTVAIRLHEEREKNRSSSISAFFLRSHSPTSSSSDAGVDVVVVLQRRTQSPDGSAARAKLENK